MSDVMHMIRLILGLSSGVIKYLYWETKWLIDSIIGEDLSEF